MRIHRKFWEVDPTTYPGDLRDPVKETREGPSSTVHDRHPYARRHRVVRTLSFLFSELERREVQRVDFGIPFTIVHENCHPLY